MNTQQLAKKKHDKIVNFYFYYITKILKERFSYVDYEVLDNIEFYGSNHNIIYEPDLLIKNCSLDWIIEVKSSRTQETLRKAKSQKLKCDEYYKKYHSKGKKFRFYLVRPKMNVSNKKIHLKSQLETRLLDKSIKPKTNDLDYWL